MREAPPVIEDYEIVCLDDQLFGRDAAVDAEARTGRARWAWFAGALVIFLLALATSFHGFWGGDLRRDVPFPASRIAGPVTTADYQMTVWATSRNARALLHGPSDIFDAEPCYPSGNGLTIYHPLITLGLLAIPGQLATGDPVAAFNLVLLLKVLIAAIAMYVLVADWTRMPAAGIVAGLLYAFAAVQIGKPFHVHHADNAWLLFALFFARRLFERGRWSDALALGACSALQMGSSFYPLMAAAATGAPLCFWLLWHHRGKPQRVLPVLVASGIAAAAAGFVLLPYLEAEGAHVAERVLHHYASWSSFLPGRVRFPGWTCLLLALAALGLGRERALAGIRGDPRAALVLAALFTALLAAGGNERAAAAAAPAIVLPNLYAAFATILPGLSAVRVVSDLTLGVHQVLCLLAGFGAAAALRFAPRRALPWATAVLIAIAFVETTRPAFIGLARHPPFQSLVLRPADETLAFFRTLEQQGNRGPLLEVPIRPLGTEGKLELEWKADIIRDQFLTAYHHRRTSSCFGARHMARVGGLDRWSRRLLEPAGIEAARREGFTTVVVHHPPGRSFAERYARHVRRLAHASEGRLALLATSESLTAYALGDPESARVRKPNLDFDEPQLGTLRQPFAGRYGGPYETRR